MYNSYGYNPYYQQQRFTGVPQQPMEQPSQIQNPLQNRGFLNGKSVDSLDVVKAMDIPLDGSISYFPLADGSAIVTKQLQPDGTSKTVVYEPTEKTKTTVEYVTQEDLKKSLSSIDLSEIDDLKDEIQEMRREFKELQKKIKNKGD